MDTNLAAWMISGGPQIELHSTERERAQLHAYRESQRLARGNRPGLVARLRTLVRPNTSDADLACCPA